MDNSNNTLVETSNNTLVDTSNNKREWTQEHTNVLNYVCSTTGLHKNEALSRLHYYNGDYVKLIQDFTINKTIEVVMRQTVYTREETVELLKKYNGDYKRIIKEYIVGDKIENTETEQKPNDKSTNQQIFSEIRGFMDNVKTQYDKRVEYQKKQELIYNYIKSQNSGEQND